MIKRKRDWTYHTCDRCGDTYPSIDNSMPNAWDFDQKTGRLLCEVCADEEALSHGEMPA